MTTNQATNFENAEAGSLWYLKNRDEDSILPHPLFHLPKSGNPDKFYDYKHVMINDIGIITKLNGARQVVGNNTTAILYKALIVLTTGETKVGWISERTVERLKPYE